MPLVRPVRDFLLEARTLQSTYYKQLEGLYDRLAHETETRTITTGEAAAMVFGPNLLKTEIYATHLALMGDGLRYVGDRGFHRITQKFQIRSKKELEMVDSVTEWVRKSSVVFDTRGVGSKVQGEMKEFVQKARHLIDLSRSLRKAKSETPGVTAERVELPEMKWTKADRMFIDFLKARMKAYGLQQTPIEGLVPYILRQTNRYPGKHLDGSTTYDFLTEIGAYSPWENVSLHQVGQALPGYNTSQQADADEAYLLKVEEKPLESLGLQDNLASIRHDWGAAKVFCVDDATAQEIDDGFSIEWVSKTETWIHVHIANPTGYLTPDHAISKVAENRMVTKYMHPLVFRMLPKPISENLGVSPGAPVFTISTKINNETGEILDYKVQPGKVNNVQRLTYDELGHILGMKRVAKKVITVGDMPYTKPPLETANVASLSKEDISTLALAKQCFLALMKRRAKAGMISLRNVVYEYKLSPEFGALSSSADLQSPFPILYRGFPDMQLLIDQQPDVRGPGDLIAEFMILANTIVSKYATENNIPMPYRTLEYNRDRPEIVKYFAEEIMPTRDEFGLAEKSVIDDLNVYLLIGFSRLLIEPGPHRLLGLPEGYVKATSPLRRYADMVAHWNLQAHLLGQPLPFPKEKLAALLPAIDMRERMANFGMNETSRFWSTIAYHRLLASPTEAKRQIPKKLTMTITERKLWPTPSVGFVQELAVMAKVQFSGIKEASAVESGDKIAVTIEEARLGERVVIFKSQGIIARRGLKLK
ncbi:hypothetical protein FN846DRAFT_772144 [Sphaerosporella brunnea]|uniref:RNB domain-containing protein n=1 Tax=Sphaerosporella brunnea TaxID=1250544 RepID=A0A5J5F944_9PEZI|nr:hypothetical protein FN846DRAFT_772144 [Sphaerosporella brunnea]